MFLKKEMQINELDKLKDDYWKLTDSINNLQELIDNSNENAADALFDGLQMYQKMRRNLFYKIRIMQNIKYEPQYKFTKLVYTKKGLQLTINNEDILIPIEKEKTEC